MGMGQNQTIRGPQMLRLVSIYQKNPGWVPSLDHHSQISAEPPEVFLPTPPTTCALEALHYAAYHGHLSSVTELLKASPRKETPAAGWVGWFLSGGGIGRSKARASFAPRCLFFFLVLSRVCAF